MFLSIYFVWEREFGLVRQFWRYTIESSEVHKSMVKVWLRVRECKSENLEFCEKLWRHAFDSSQMYKCLVRIRLRASACKDENLELYKSFWRHESFRVHESKQDTIESIGVVYKPEFGVICEFVEESRGRGDAMESSQVQECLVIVRLRV